MDKDSRNLINLLRLTVNDAKRQVLDDLVKLLDNKSSYETRAQAAVEKAANRFHDRYTHTTLSLVTQCIKESVLEWLTLTGFHATSNTFHLKVLKFYVYGERISTQEWKRKNSLLVICNYGEPILPKEEHSVIINCTIPELMVWLTSRRAWELAGDCLDQIEFNPGNLVNLDPSIKSEEELKAALLTWASFAEIDSFKLVEPKF